ncbi:MAG: tRNA (adenosine(37)-N6)-threonylcarbamoyltransferase complex ATPase subunit type 1 TsaE [Bacteroidales bacterium]|jgi:tRNA threonylcarbamoyladenosine biosynthesis protein TsaE|nr:tRNA (adenosine(37)-N6)-threonylcarbamoyltransferase complex ATPase subunit type 1 TsaE [Bacteroidales bacterium]
MQTFEKDITNLEQLPSVAKELLTAFPQARVFAFYAEMGAGKTTFIKALCEELSALDVVNSPTFAIINEYRTKHHQPIFHFDFYRLKNLREACDLGCEEYFYSGNYCFLEWAELVEPLLPQHFLKIEIAVSDSKTRRISATQTG